MRAFVRFQLPDGRHVDLGHGDIIGRLGAARLCLADPSVSEAHAMVSLRGQDLLLLGLRGRFVTDVKPLSKLVLEVGQRIKLSRQTHLTVSELHLPDSVLALEGPGLGRRVLAGVCSLSATPDGLEIAPRFDPDAAAWVFNVDGAWHTRSRNEEGRPLRPGDTIAVGGHIARAVSVDLHVAAENETVADGAVGRPLRILARYETVHIHRDPDPVLVLSGISARIVSELVATQVPTPWEVIAREVWDGEDAEPGELRGRFDAAMLRLRKKLRAAGVRGDLVRTDGHGSLELVRYPGDRIEDQS